MESLPHFFSNSVIFHCPELSSLIRATFWILVLIKCEDVHMVSVWRTRDCLQDKLPFICGSSIDIIYVTFVQNSELAVLSCHELKGSHWRSCGVLVCCLFKFVTSRRKSRSVISGFDILHELSLRHTTHETFPLTNDILCFWIALLARDQIGAIWAKMTCSLFFGETTQNLENP